MHVLHFDLNMCWKRVINIYVDCACCRFFFLSFFLSKPRSHAMFIGSILIVVTASKIIRKIGLWTNTFDLENGSNRCIGNVYGQYGVWSNLSRMRCFRKFVLNFVIRSTKHWVSENSESQSVSHHIFQASNCLHCALAVWHRLSKQNVFAPRIFFY